MTTMMAAAAETVSDADTDAAESWPVCWECAGPCLTYKGSVHGWRCTACIDAYLDAGERAWQARSEKAKERITRNLLHSNVSQSPVTANDRRREGGGSALCAAPPLPASTDPLDRNGIGEPT